MNLSKTPIESIKEHTKESSPFDRTLTNCLSFAAIDKKMSANFQPINQMGFSQPQDKFLAKQ